MGLYIEDLAARFPNQLVTIFCGVSEGQSGIKPMEGILLEDSMDFSLSAEFVDGVGATLSNNLISAGTEVIGKYVGKSAGEAVAKLNTLMQTAQDWQGGSKFAFSVSFNVFKTKKDAVGQSSSFKSLFTNLARMTQSKPQASASLPQVSHYDSLITFNENSETLGEMAYDIAKRVVGNADAKEKNLFTVTIGKWFKCSKLIVKSTGMKLSTFTDLNGSPIYTTVTISFETYRVLNSEEWSEIIRI